MINAIELRIGNWVKETGKDGYTCVACDDIVKADKMFEWCYPIKITESNTAGFNVTKLKNIIDVLQIVRSEPLVVPQVFYIMMTLAGKLKLKIEYVHQLQNLYLDITGEYLEWTPEKERSKLTIV